MRTNNSLLTLITFLLSANTLWANNWTDSVLNNMNLDEKIGQFFMSSGYSNYYVNYEVKLFNHIRKHKPGGVILFQGDVKRQVELSNILYGVSTTPFFIDMVSAHVFGLR